MAFGGLTAAMRGGSFTGFRGGRGGFRYNARGPGSFSKGFGGAGGGSPRTGTAPASGVAGAPKPQPSPLDSTYFANVASNDFKTNNQINALNMRQSNAQTNLQTQLAAMQHQQPLDQLRLEQQANQRGALYSTPYGQQLGQLNYGYLGRESAAQTNFGQLVSSIASQIAGLHGAQSIYNSGQAEAAAERAAALAQKNPALGESSRPLTHPRSGGGMPRAGRRGTMTHRASSPGRF